MTDVVSRSWPALGTTATVAATAAGVLDTAVVAVTREIDAIDRACSRFRADSELSALNAAAGQPFQASGLLIEALEVAVSAASITGGLVDPTVGQALRVLGYDRDFATLAPDGPPLQARVGPVPGWQVIEIDHRRGIVRVPAGVSIDLGATAKALCADRAAAAAATATAAGVLVSLGGDIAVAGPGPAGGWPVGIADDHRADPSDVDDVVALDAGGMATSGTAARRWRRGGVALHHLVDPVTGRPASGPWRTVTVVAASCVDANVASTAAVIAGSSAPVWLERLGLAARLVADDGAIATTAAWPVGEAAVPCSP